MNVDPLREKGGLTMYKPNLDEMAVAMALLEQLLADFEPVDEDDMRDAEIASKVAKYWLKLELKTD